MDQKQPPPTITPQTTLEEVLQHPQGKQLLEKFRFPCLTCPLARLEMDQLTLQEIARNYNLDLDGFLAAINQPQ